MTLTEHDEPVVVVGAGQQRHLGVVAQPQQSLRVLGKKPLSRGQVGVGDRCKHRKKPALRLKRSRGAQVRPRIRRGYREKRTFKR